MKKGSKLSFALACAAAVTCAAPVAATARTSFNGNVCSLLKPTQVAAFHITPLKCVARSIPGNGASGQVGTWGSILGSTHLTVSVVTYNNPTIFQFARNRLSTLPGRSKKVNGIGSAAYESGADGGTVASMNFVVKHTICNINLRTAKPVRSLAQFNALAKSIAGKL